MFKNLTITFTIVGGNENNRDELTVLATNNRFTKFDTTVFLAFLIEKVKTGEFKIDIDSNCTEETFKLD